MRKLDIAFKAYFLNATLSYLPQPIMLLRYQLLLISAILFVQSQYILPSLPFAGGFWKNGIFIVMYVITANKLNQRSCKI